jgi:hypothetical protein
MFQAGALGKIKSNFWLDNPPPENRAVYETMEKCGGAGQATDGSVIRRT